MLGSLWTSLEELRIVGCSLLEVIFRIREFNATSTPVVMDTQLRVLDIQNLPSLKHVWDKDPKGILTFHNLESVKVSNCQSLNNLFPTSVAKGLSQLQHLEIYHSGLEEIVAMGGVGIEEVVKFEFPRVSSLVLWNLTRFRHFYPGECRTEWPMLKFLHFNCGKIKKRNEQQGQLDFPVQQPLFCVEKDSFPCLEELKLGWNDGMEEIWHDQYLGDYFPKLKHLELIQFQKLPSFFFQLLPSLEKLIVSEASFTEIFQCERLRGEERPGNAPYMLRELKLSKLSTLMHLWKEETNLKHVFYNLRTLEVLACCKLMNLVPYVASFENLQILKVSKCHGLINLMSYSTAKSLVQLTRMSITDCDMIEEIVECLEDDVNDGIVFTKLKFLQLCGLPRLASFCSEKCNFEFSSLEEVIVEGCPRMKIFSVGEVRTSQLERVQFTENKDTWCWEGDLNTTIQKLFIEKVLNSGLENLCLRGDGNALVETWNENPQEILDFEKLKCLEFINCSSLKYLLTPSMVSSLVQLQDLKVKNCSAMEQVIMVKKVEEGAETELIFPQLNSILLVSCSNLTSFCAATYPLKFPSVIEIAIRDCPNMATFASPFSSEHEKETAKGESEERIEKEEPGIPIEPFLSDKVHFSILERLELTSVGIHQICHSQVPGISPFVENLTELTIGICFNLKYLMTFSMFKSFVQLKKLKIFKCKILEGVILMEGLAEEERMFPKLERLELFDLPKLKRFCSYSDSLEEIYDPQGVNDSGLQATQSTLVQTAATKVVFPQVTYLKLSHLPALKISCPQEEVAKWPLLKYVQAIFPCLEELELGWNDIMNEIWYGQHPEEYFCKLKALKLLGFPAFLRPFFFQSLPNLEKLVVIDSFFSELFQCEEVGIEEKPVCGQTLLRELKLSKLHELTHLWKEESQLEPVFNNLRTIVVRKCGKLNNLVPSAVYFENLQTLKVSQCHGLVNLVRYSTAKSLVQLTRLQVINCEMIEEIVGCSSDDVKGDIVFTKLEYLRFKGLPRLASFCSGSCNFIFPSLEVVIVRECSKMQNFSVGEVITTKLQKVKLTAYDFGGRWGGNLNHTIQQLFTGKSASDSEDEYSEEDYFEDEYSEDEYSEEEYSEEESD